MSVYKIDGVTVVAPNKLGCGDNVVSRSYRDANGIFRDKLISRQRTVRWGYEDLTKAQFQAIYNIVWTKIKTQGTRYFNITTQFPGEGDITSVFYLGTPTNFDSILGTKANGIERWKVDLEWVEVEGTSLVK